MTENTRHLKVEGGVNVRDLGGYLTKDGYTTRWRTLIRSAGLDHITDKGQRQLLDYGVKTIVDLRDDREVIDYPDVFAHGNHAHYVNLPLSPSGFASGTDYAHLGELYCQYLSAFQVNIGKIIAAIAESEAGILFHCAVGKDRTGIVSALLLDLVGVPVEVIAEDYALTTPQIAPMVAEWRVNALQKGHNMVHFERDVAADAELMLHMLKVLNEDYGGAAQYLQTCRVTPQQLTRLHTLLVAS